MNLPLQVNLKDKVCVVTGGAGVLGGYWSAALAASGAKVAVLDRNLEFAQKKAEEITAEGGICIGVQADVLNKESLKAAHEEVLAKFGPCELLLNGAGGNHPRGTTTKEYLYEEDLLEENKDLFTFF
ncbi:MAG TPA: SDR family NAD(P)-dependent oxidoreductase, partial [Clostridiaceae bacterium]|nr:SDR family NAD(P)-dependent oxidoreductase [Clostridiaceae bacterium]